MIADDDDGERLALERLTLRDLFALVVLHATVKDAASRAPEGDDVDVYEVTCDTAYDWADAMLNARANAIDAAHERALEKP